MIVVPALLALGFVVVGTARFRLHPFVALLVAAFGLGLGSGMPTSDVARHAAEGFGSTASAIGVVIAAGALIGVVLEATGGAEALATGTLAAVGERFALIAVGLAGLLVGVPVFCDSGFVLLAPVVRRLAVRAGERREVALVMLSMGLYMTHVLVPPTPGPVAAAGALGVDLSRMIALGFFVALPALAAVRAYARWASGSAPEAPEPSAVLGSSESGAPSAVTDAARPPGFARALAPILLPVLLLAVRSWALPFKTASSGAVFAFVEFLGHPWVALFVGAAVAFVALGWSARARWLAWSEDALRIAGPIVLITAAGGAFGGVLRATSLTGLLSGVAGAAPAGTLALVIPFVVAALLKTGVGSSTVAIVTAAQVCAPMVAGLGLDGPWGRAFAALAIGAGSMVVSHGNDSYFWVVKGVGNLEVGRTFRMHTGASLVAGVAVMLALLVLRVILTG